MQFSQRANDSASFTGRTLVALVVENVTFIIVVFVVDIGRDTVVYLLVSPKQRHLSPKAF